MQTLLIVAGIVIGIIAAAIVASVVFRYSDKWRARQKAAAAERQVRLRAEADEYVIVHALLATAIKQASNCKSVDAKLLKAQLIKAKSDNDLNEMVAARRTLDVFLGDCEDLINRIRVAINYDHKHSKKLPETYQETLVEQHKQWHTIQRDLKDVKAEIRVFAHTTS